MISRLKCQPISFITTTRGETHQTFVSNLGWVQFLLLDFLLLAIHNTGGSFLVEILDKGSTEHTAVVKSKLYKESKFQIVFNIEKGVS